MEAQTIQPVTAGDLPELRLDTEEILVLSDGDQSAGWTRSDTGTCPSTCCYSCTWSGCSLAI